jgi:regulatory protein
MTTAPQRQPAGSAPDAAALHDAALAYLARYAATEMAVRRALERRVDRWSRAATLDGGDAEVVAAQAAAARTLVRDVVARLVAAGAVNDAAFAETRSRNLVRAGRSRRAVIANLAAKGVASETVHSALPDDPRTELAAALVLTRRRRIGPFSPATQPDQAQRHRELGILARAGFPQDVARRALAMDPAEAEALIIQLRR